MIPIFQTIQNDKNGNCYAACIASILEVPLETIPNFMEEGPDYFLNKLDKWSKKQNFIVLSITLDPLNEELVELYKDLYMIGSLPSQRFKDATHAVVCKGIKIVHDPNPESKGGHGHPTSFDIFIIKDLKKYITLPNKMFSN